MKQIHLFKKGFVIFLKGATFSDFIETRTSDSNLTRLKTRFILLLKKVSKSVDIAIVSRPGWIQSVHERSGDKLHRKSGLKTVSLSQESSVKVSNEISSAIVAEK